MSVCSSPCKRGQFRNRISTCCWECRECAYTDIVNATNPFTCIACKDGWAPNLPQNACVAIPVQHLAYDNPYVVVILVLSSLGIGTCLIVSIVFVFKRATPIVKATGFETSLVLLVGILFSYISPFIIVMEPSEASCSFFRIFLGLSYTMAYSSILSKLMVYNRAFDVQSSIKNKSIQGNTIVCTIKTALVISLSLSAIHLLAIVFWIIGDVPTPVVSYSRRGSISIVCRPAQLQLLCLSWMVVPAYDSVLGIRHQNKETTGWDKRLARDYVLFLHFIRSVDRLCSTVRLLGEQSCESHVSLHFLNHSRHGVFTLSVYN